MGALATIDVADLVGRPYVRYSNDPAVGLDCWGVGVVLHRRLGHGEVRPDPALWEPLGCDLARAGEVGDLAVGDATDGAVAVAWLVQASPKLWLTATEQHGTHKVRTPHIGTLRGVYRWRGAP